MIVSLKNTNDLIRYFTDNRSFSLDKKDALEDRFVRAYIISDQHSFAIVMQRLLMFMVHDRESELQKPVEFLLYLYTQDSFL
jgi:hypothetical protein